MEKEKEHDGKKPRVISFGWKDITVLITLVISIFSFVFSTWPQCNFLNKNFEARANAGDNKSQLFLAHHFYEVGDTGKSLYWYKIVTTNKSYKHYGLAMNNLACIYLNADLPVGNGKHYHKIEYDLLNESAKAGSKEGRRNLYLLLVSTPDQEWTEIVYADALDEAKRRLADNGEWTEELAAYETEWELVENTEGLDLSDTSRYKQVQTVIGCDTVRTTSEGGIQVVPIFGTTVYQKRESTPEPEFQYQNPPDDLLG